MNVPLLDLQAQYATIRDRILAAVEEVFASQRFILGPQVTALEEEVAGLCGVQFAVGVASGTDALLLSLKALGIGKDDAVVTVPYTFFSTAGTIVNLGARPLFVDIEESSFNMDPDRLSLFFANECTFNLSAQKLVHKASNATIRVIVPVHLYGQCADMDSILEIARRYRLAVVEDACQALGAMYRNQYAGTMGDLGCFSFFPSKNLGGAGDGGMIITSNQALAAKVRLLREHGAHPKYFHAIVGFNSRLDELQAAVLRVKLPYLKDWSQGRRQNAKRYTQELRLVARSSVDPPAILPERTHIFNQYVIRCKKRNELRAFLKSKNVATEIYYPVSLHEQECFSGFGYNAFDFPQSHAAAQAALALPVYPELTDEQISHVVNTIAQFYRNEHRAT